MSSIQNDFYVGRVRGSRVYHFADKIEQSTIVTDMP